MRIVTDRCSMYTTQISVDEVYSFFKDPKKEQPDFKALRLMPTPMTAAKPDAWKQTALYNPMPLWVADSDKQAENQPWRLRMYPDDHSDYTPCLGKPDFDPGTSKDVPFIGKIAFGNNECTKIRDGQFLRADQYPIILPVQPRVGLLQLCQAGNEWDDKTDLHDSVFCNAWSPVVLDSVVLQPADPDNFNTKLARGFTMRQQIRSLATRDNYKTAMPIQAARYYDGSKTNVILFRLADVTKLQGNFTIKASCYVLTDPGQNTATQFSYTPGMRWPILTSALVFDDHAVASVSNIPTAHVNNLRFVLFNDPPPSTTPPLVVGVYVDKTVLFTQVTNLKSLQDTITSITKPDWAVKQANDPNWPAQPFIKPMRAGGAARNVSFTMLSEIQDSQNFKILNALLAITDAKGDVSVSLQPSVFTEQIQFRCSKSAAGYSNIRSSCVLVRPMPFLSLATPSEPYSLGPRGGFSCFLAFSAQLHNPHPLFSSPPLSFLLGFSLLPFYPLPPFLLRPSRSLFSILSPDHGLTITCIGRRCSRGVHTVGWKRQHGQARPNTRGNNVAVVHAV